MSRVAHSATSCYGCRTCQLVCSLHLTGCFWPEQSSIQVARTPQTGAVRWSIDERCDECAREEAPLCVRYCAYGALEMLGPEATAWAEP